MAWTAACLLQAWESAVGLPPPARTAVMLCAEGRVPVADAALDLDVDTAARLVGASLIESFGPTADLVVTCPACGEVLQADVAVPHEPPPDTSAGGGGGLLSNGWVVRPPTLRELSSVYGTPEAAARLRAWCVTADRMDTGAEPGSAATVPLPGDEVLDEAMKAVAGAGLLDGAVECPECGETFTAGLDLGHLLWGQVCLRAPRILADVAALARAYGWSERSILELSDARRAAYLEFAGGA